MYEGILGSSLLVCSNDIYEKEVIYRESKEKLKQMVVWQKVIKLTLHNEFSKL